MPGSAAVSGQGTRCNSCPWDEGHGTDRAGNGLGPPAPGMGLRDANTPGATAGMAGRRAALPVTLPCQGTTLRSTPIKESALLVEAQLGPEALQGEWM